MSRVSLLPQSYHGLVLSAAMTLAAGTLAAAIARLPLSPLQHRVIPARMAGGAAPIPLPDSLCGSSFTPEGT